MGCLLIIMSNIFPLGAEDVARLLRVSGSPGWDLLHHMNWAWWCIQITPALNRWKLEWTSPLLYMSEASLGYMRYCL